MTLRICHLLDLIIKHSTDKLPSMLKFMVCTKSLIGHFNKSGYASAALKEIIDMLNINIETTKQEYRHKYQKFSQDFTVRWISC